jgi:hypothetical protein
LLAIAALVLLAPPSMAQEGDEADRARIEELERRVAVLQAQLDSVLAGQADADRLGELRQQINAISRQIEVMQLGREVVEAGDGRFGLGPAASKVYGVHRGVSIGGYGEMRYQNFSSTRQDGTASGKKDQIDFVRAVLYFGYKFNDKILFNSEIEFEHASTSNAGSVAVEFAYVDFFLTPWIGARAGLLLLPVGYINELHEPPIYLGVGRPETEQRIIPTTWRENGLGLFGETGGFSYRAYAINAFDAIGDGSSNAAGFDATGLRGGRQKGSKAVIENIAGVGRVDYVGVLGLNIGSSLYYGNAGQGNVDSVGRVIAAPTLIWEGHAQYRAHGFWLRGLYTLSTVGDVARLNDAQGFTGNESIGERLTGWYLEAGYDMLHSMRTEHQVIPYARYEQINTQVRVPVGFSADPATDQTVATVGAMWKPITNIAVKADYMFRHNAARTGVDQWNLGLGFLF